jgi:alpha-glucosidase
MQWDASEYAGFSKVQPWLPVADDYRQRNVATQRNVPHSMLSLYRRLLALRRSEPALSIGSYQAVTVEGDDAARQSVLAFIREADGCRFLIALNLASHPARMNLSAIGAGTVALSTHLDRGGITVRGRMTTLPLSGTQWCLRCVRLCVTCGRMPEEHDGWLCRSGSVRNQNTQMSGAQLWRWRAVWTVSTVCT